VGHLLARNVDHGWSWEFGLGREKTHESILAPEDAGGEIIVNSFYTRGYIGMLSSAKVSREGFERAGLGTGRRTSEQDSDEVRVLRLLGVWRVPPRQMCSILLLIGCLLAKTVPKKYKYTKATYMCAWIESDKYVRPKELLSLTT